MAEQLKKDTEVKLLNAFTDNDKGGNPAGVVLDADELSNAAKQAIAAKLGLSEVAFVSSSAVADFKLDFFTPTRQIAHCGHATIATFSYLSQTGRIKQQHSSKETIDGRREILIQGELAFMEQKAPAYLDSGAQRTTILQSLNLTEKDLVKDAPVSIVNTGNSFAVIPVLDSTVLKNIAPDFKLINEVSEAFDLIGYYVFCTETSSAERDASTRMFAPRYGIEEESATGMAAGPLACYLYDVMGIKKKRYMIEQGWFMEKPSPSLILVDIETADGKIKGLMAGGKGIATGAVNIEY
ncbi:MAG: PhzF family phenazine biosynthesis protein [Ferruginibacter sp.]